MQYKVYQVDAWGNPKDGYTYNETFLLKKVYIENEPTKRKILNALRRNNYIPKSGEYDIDDSVDNVYTVLDAKTYKPLFDLMPA